MPATGPEAAANECLGIVGVGLIGGSIGLAARRAGHFSQILGAGRDPATLERARGLGCIDEGFTDLRAIAKKADVLVFCTPVDRIAPQILSVASHCRPGILITDAGSTKAEIVAALEHALPPHVRFVGAHPLAGSEKRGPENARADLFDHRLTVLTPTALTAPADLERAGAFWKSLGCRVRAMGPDQHDRALATTSHLPHLLAAALAGLLPLELRDLTATGFRDATRLAGGDSGLWTAILMQNSGHIAAALGELERRLAEFKSAMLGEDAATLERLLSEAKKVRDDLGS